MVDEIAREYRNGIEINEGYILNLFLILNMIFSIGIFVLLLKTFKLVEIDKTKVKSIDEKIFVIAQVMGIIAGFMGLLFTFHFIKVPAPFFWFVYYIFMVLLLFSSGTLYFFKIRDID